MSAEFRLEESLGYLLNRVAGKMRMALERALAEHEVTAQQWAALALLGGGGQVSLLDVAAGLGVDLGATSRLISRLEEKELVTRSKSDADGRVMHLALTPKAQRLLPKLARSAAEVNLAFEAGMSPSERRLLVSTLDRILRHDTAEVRVKDGRRG